MRELVSTRATVSQHRATVFATESLNRIRALRQAQSFIFDPRSTAELIRFTRFGRTRLIDTVVFS